MKTRIPLIIVTIAAACFAVLLMLGHGADRLIVGDAAFDRIEIEVNQFTASAQSHIALDMDEHGRVVATCDSRRQDLGTYGVFARWIDPPGRARGSEERVNIERRATQMNPAVSIRDGGTAWFAQPPFRCRDRVQSRRSSRPTFRRKDLTSRVGLVNVCRQIYTTPHDGEVAVGNVSFTSTSTSPQ